MGYSEYDPAAKHRRPWNVGRMVGAKRALKPQQVWAIRFWLDRERRLRDRAMMARFDSANAAYGESYLLLTILAGVLGGISPMGGYGTVGGLVIALAILQLISTACILLDLSQFLTLSLWGGILLIVTFVTRLANWIGAFRFLVPAPIEKTKTEVI
jgi:hypothetical protein